MLADGREPPQSGTSRVRRDREVPGAAVQRLGSGKNEPVQWREALQRNLPAKSERGILFRSVAQLYCCEMLGNGSKPVLDVLAIQLERLAFGVETSERDVDEGDESTAVLVLKPQMPGLDTNLLITTDRRAYYVRLVSKAEDYVSRVAFEYNDDDGGKKWRDHFTEQKRAELAAARDPRQEPSGLLLSVEHLHFDYQIKGGDEYIRPQRVFDDGSKTYIQMSANVANREAPVLVIVGKDGKGEVVNYRMKDQTYIVDRLFERAQLVLGSGKKAQKVEISRDHRG